MRRCVPLHAHEIRQRAYAVRALLRRFSQTTVRRAFSCATPARMPGSGARCERLGRRGGIARGANGGEMTCTLSRSRNIKAPCTGPAEVCNACFRDLVDQNERLLTRNIRLEYVARERKRRYLNVEFWVRDEERARIVYLLRAEADRMQERAIAIPLGASTCSGPLFDAPLYNLEKLRIEAVRNAANKLERGEL